MVGQYESFLKNFATFMARAETHLHKDKDKKKDNTPRFMGSPTNSCLTIVDYANYNALDASGKLKLFEGKSAVVVRKWPVDQNLKFDEAGLRTVAACLASPVDLLGESIATQILITL